MIYDYGDDDDDDVGCGGSDAGDDSGDDDVCGCQRYVFTQFFLLGLNFQGLSLQVSSVKHAIRWARLDTDVSGDSDPIFTLL